jgi:predicted Zn-dependent protease
LAQQSQPAEAEREFRAAIAANPSLLIAHRNMVTMLAEQGKLEEGIAHLAELSKQMPANAEIRQLLDTLRATAGK